MQRLYDSQTQQWVEVPDEQVAEGVASGRFQYDSRVGEVPMFSPEGERWAVPAENAAEAYRRGFQPYTQARSDTALKAETQANVEENFGGGGPGGASLTALTGGFLSGMSGGLSDLAIKGAEGAGLLPEGVTDARAASKAVNPGSDIVGEIGGLVSPFSAAGKAAGAATKAVGSGLTRAGAGAIESTAAKLATGAFEGAFYSVPGAVSSATLGDPDQVAETLLSTLQEGAEIGALLPGLGLGLKAISPAVNAVAEGIGNLFTKGAQKSVKAALPAELKPLAEDAATRAAVLSDEIAPLAKAVEGVDDSVLGVTKRLEGELNRGLKAERGELAIEARKAGEAAVAADDAVKAAAGESRDLAAAQLSEMQSARAGMQRRLAEDRALDKLERKRIQTEIRGIDKQIKAAEAELADTQAALRSSFKHETAEAQRGADDLLRANTGDILAARNKAAELNNSKYAELNKWLDESDPFLDDVKLALHSDVNPARLFDTVQAAQATVRKLQAAPSPIHRRVATNIDEILTSLVGKEALAAKDATSMFAMLEKPRLGKDLFQAEYSIKQAIGGAYGKSKNPGNLINAAYNEFRERTFNAYGDLGKAANEASDAYRVYAGFRNATKAIKGGNESVKILRQLYTDPEKAKAVDAVSSMIADGKLIPEFQALAKTREGTKGYFEAMDNLQNAIRQEHVAASSARLTPEQILHAGQALNQAPLAPRYEKFESVASRLAATEAKVNTEIGQLSKQRAALAERQAETAAAGAPKPELAAELDALDQQIAALRVQKKNPFVSESLTEAASKAALERNAITGRANDVHDAMVAITKESPTFKFEAADYKMLADRFFPGGKFAQKAADAVAFKDGYAKLVAENASPLDKYFFMLRNTGGNVSKEMENLATALPYYEAIEKIERGLSNRDLASVIGRKVGQATVGGVLGTMLGGPLGGIAGSGLGAMLTGGVNPVSALRTLSAIEKGIAASVKATDSALKRAVEGFQGSGLKKVAVPVYAAPEEKERKVVIRNVVERLTSLNSPDAIASQLSPTTKQLPSQVAAAVTKQYSQRVQFLQSKLPVDPLAGKYPMLKNKPTYPESELRRFARYVDAAEQPLKALERIAAGAGTPEEIQTVKTLYPRLWESFKLSMFDAIASSDKELNYQQRITLGTTFDAVTDPTLDPQFMGRLYQPEFNRIAQQEQAIAGAVAEPRTKSLTTQLASDQETSVQKISEGTS